MKARTFSIFTVQGHLHEENLDTSEAFIDMRQINHFVFWHNVGTIACAASPVLAPPVAAISWDIATTQVACDVSARGCEDKGMMVDDFISL